MRFPFSFQNASPTVPTVDELLHLIITGQSNAIGAEATPLLSDAVINSRCLMFNGGPFPGGEAGSLASFEPLVARVDSNLLGETIGYAIARYLSARLLSANILITHVGVNGARYSQLKKGTTPFTNSLAQVAAAKALADVAGLSYRLLAVCAVHGETDEQFQDLSYQAELLEWQTDYETDAQVISGQAEAIPLFACQQAGYAASQYAAGGELTTLGGSTMINLFRAHAADPAQVVLVTPRYFLDHIDGLHLSAYSQSWLGQIYGRAIHRELFGSGFQPILPLTALLTADQIVLTFAVPVAPLRWDFTQQLYQANYGFSFFDESASAAIESVAITDDAEITITLDGVPSGANPQIRYATIGDPDWPKFIGGRGNLADSDSTLTDFGTPLKSFCPVFALDL